MPFFPNSSLFCIYFTLLLPIFSFLSHFILFPSSFFLSLLHFPSFSFPLFIFFPPNDTADIPPPREGGWEEYFPIYVPLKPSDLIYTFLATCRFHLASLDLMIGFLRLRCENKLTDNDIKISESTLCT
jgi:hypothetical protein